MNQKTEHRESRGRLQPQMTARPHSPNWHWLRLGYMVERDARGARTIRRPDGSTVEVSRHDGEDSYSAELRAAEREQQQGLKL